MGRILDQVTFTMSGAENANAELPVEEFWGAIDVPPERKPIPVGWMVGAAVAVAALAVLAKKKGAPVAF